MSSRRVRGMRAIPLVLVFHVLFAATAFFTPRVVSAAGTDTAAASAVEDTQLLEVVPAGGAVVAPSHDNDNDNEVEHSRLQGGGGGAVAWAAEAAGAAVGRVEKTVRDVVSSFFEPGKKEEALEEEVVGASVSDRTATATAAATIEVEDSDSFVLQEEAMDEAVKTHGKENEEEEQEEEASDVVLETTTEIIFLYDDDGGGGGASGEEEVEEGEQSYLIIMSTEEEEDEREEQQVPVVTSVTTTTTTITTSSSTITTVGTTTEEEETSVFTVTETAVEEGAAEQQAEVASIDGDVVIFSIGSEDTNEATAAERLAMLTAGNGVSLSGDVPSDGWQLLEQRQVDAAYNELLNLEAETRPSSNIFTEWDSGRWPGDDNVAGPGDSAGYFVGPDESASNIVSLEDLSVSSSLVRSLLPTTWWDSFGVSTGTRAGDTPFRRRGPMPGSITLIFTDDQWPTPFYSTRWTLSVDLVGLVICALSLTIVIIIVFSLSEDEREEEEEQQQEEEQHDEEFDQERGVSLSDVREEERETLLNAPEPVNPKPSKSADTAKKGAHTEYVQEPPVWTNPCATWDYL